jgi:hypothetical protein
VHVILITGRDEGFGQANDTDGSVVRPNLEGERRKQMAAAKAYAVAVSLILVLMAFYASTELVIAPF